MKIPLLDLQAQYRPIRDEILAAMTRVADSQRFIMGPEIDALEQELAALLGIRHAIAVSSGSDALIVALMALDDAMNECAGVMTSSPGPMPSARMPSSRADRPESSATQCFASQ